MLREQQLKWKLGASALGFLCLDWVSCILENFEIKTMLLIKEALLKMAQSVLKHFLNLSGVVLDFVKEFLACCGIVGANQRLTPTPPPWAPTWECSWGAHDSWLAGEHCKLQVVGFLPCPVASHNSNPPFPMALGAFLIQRMLKAAAEQPLALASPTVSVGGLLPWLPCNISKGFIFVPVQNVKGFQHLHLKNKNSSVCALHFPSKSTVRKGKACPCSVLASPIQSCVKMHLKKGPFFQ